MIHKHTRILRLSKAGFPTDWISFEDAATLITKDQVLWTLGDDLITLHGGCSRVSGEQSTLTIPSIIASEGRVNPAGFSPALTNRLLFRRDQNLCLYCGKTFADKHLSRDHVHPRSRGGPDIWMNVVTSCKRCNNRKADRTPEEANMPLLATPFIPNMYEHFYLDNRHILADQMEFLKSGFSKNLCGIQ